MFENTIFLVFFNFFRYGENFICNTAAYSAAAFNIEHGRVRFTKQRMVPYNIGIIDRRFRFNPADEVPRALVACRTAKSKHFEIRTEFFFEILNLKK